MMKYEEFSDRMPALTELTLDEALQHAARAASKLKRDLDQEKATSRDHFEKVTRQRQNLNGLQAKCNQAEARAKATSESGDILQKQMREVEEHLRRSEAALRTEQLERKAAEESRKIMEERYLATRQAFETAEHARKGAEEGRKTAEAATEVARDGRRKAEEGEKTAKQTLGSAERLAAGEKHLAERQAALNAEEHGMRAEREALAAELERAVEALLRRSKDSEPGTPRACRAHSFPPSSGEDDDTPPRKRTRYNTQDPPLGVYVYDPDAPSMHAGLGSRSPTPWDRRPLLWKDGSPIAPALADILTDPPFSPSTPSWGWP